jgi:hypothetical protein
MSTLPEEGDTGPKFQFSSLTQDDRNDIVQVAGTQDPTFGAAFVAGNQVRLSALGATLDLLGTWQQTPNNGLASWRQLTTDGRDQYVKVVHYGYHFPLGHKATLTTITRRVLSPDPVNPGQYADAYLQNYSFITTSEPLKAYPATGQPYLLGAWPFTSAQILTLVSPDLDPAFKAQALGVMPPTSSDDYPQAFFPTNNGNPVLWAVNLVDNAGTVVSLRLPLVFVFAHDASTYTYNQYDAAQMGDIAAAYNALGQQSNPSSMVTSSVAGTPILYAPEVTTNGVPNPGATTHPTLAITLGAATPASVPTPTPNQDPGSDQYVPPPPPTSQASLTEVNQPAFYPSLLTAQIRLPAAESLSRSSFNDGTGPGGVAIFLYGPYITDGFTDPSSSGSDANRPAVTPADSPVDPSGSTNPGAVYAGLLNKPPLNFPADMVGGLANPNLGVNGLSAAAGAIGGDLSQYATQAEATVADYFSGLTSSNFLGGLSLADILGEFTGDLKAPTITQQVADDGTRTVTYLLKAQLLSGTTVFTPVSPDGAFTLTATVTITPSGSTTFKIQGVVDAFTITILDGAPIIQIPFGDASSPGATFTASSGAKSNIRVNVGQPTFEGALSFVNALEQFLSDIGGSGVSIDVEPAQISASLSLALPSVGIGVFNLENLALSASVVIPFLGDATIATFAFCSQEQPFSLTVLCFGGGGYLLVAVGLNSLESLTASFDFEGQFGLDLTVASGGVSVMAGITFSYAAPPATPPAMPGATLTGFVRITGEVEVLGILSISLEVQLSLSYNTSDHTATGTATMTVSISLCFFSVSVSVTVQKSFAGSGTSSSVSSAMPQVREAMALPVGSGAPVVAQEHRVAASGTNPFASTSATTFKDQMSSTDWASYCAAFGS